MRQDIWEKTFFKKFLRKHNDFFLIIYKDRSFETSNIYIYIYIYIKSIKECHLENYLNLSNKFINIKDKSEKKELIKKRTFTKNTW